MATHADNTDHLIQQALDEWRRWSCADALTERPVLGTVIGEGSANRIYSLRNQDRYVLRVRHATHDLSINKPHQEVAIWQHAAQQGLAPKVVYDTGAGSVVVTERLTFGEVTTGAHTSLLNDIHKLCYRMPILSLNTVAVRYWSVIQQQGIAHLAIDPRADKIKGELDRLDSDITCVCHNDLSTANIGQLNGVNMAIDWEYAALGNPHFDAAIASEGLEWHRRISFAESALGQSFNSRTWLSACRAELLINHLWMLATHGTLSASLATALTKEQVEQAWSDDK